MAKLDHLRQKKLNPADELRSLLNELEDSQSRLKSFNATQTLDLLRDLDQVYALLNHLETTGANLASEWGRFGAIQAYFRNNAGTFLRRLGGPAALAEYRPKPAPERERWWWYIHELVAAQQQRLLRQVTFGVLILLVFVGGIALAFNTILAPSPEALARVEAENDAFSAYEDGNYEEGLAAIETGLAVVPDDPSLLLIQGMLYEMLDEEEKAAQSYDRAKQAAGPPVNFYVGRGQLYIRTSQFEKAETDARAALALDEELPIAWLLLGQALESQGRRFESISAYEQAGDLALASGDSQIVVLARLALGRITSSP
jgi:tetratricopeptide (TPR) repeat protein